MAARGRKPKTERKTSSLLAAIKFISPAQMRDGLPYQRHCLISNGMIIGFDGGITIGHPIEEDLETCCPNSALLLAAMNKCGEGYTITQDENGKLKIKSGKFSATIPCMELIDMARSEPDVLAGNIGETVRFALSAVMGLATEGDSDPKKAAVMLGQGVACATNGAALLEAWHGCSLPPSMLIPRSSVNAIVKCESSMIGIGYSGKSLTVWFENKAFVKTQLFGASFPDYAKLFADVVADKEVPESFFEAIETLKDFCEKDDPFIYFKEGFASSSISSNEGADFQLDFSPAGFYVNHEYIKLVKHAMKRANFNIAAAKCVFYGEKVRGIILGKSK